MQERHFIDRLDAFRRGGERRRRVAVLAGFHTGLIRQLDELRADAVRVERGGVSLVPLDLECASAGDGLPVRIGHDRYTRGATGGPGAARPGPGACLERDDGTHARHRFGLAGVE